MQFGQLKRREFISLLGGAARGGVVVERIRWPYIYLPGLGFEEEIMRTLAMASLAYWKMVRLYHRGVCV
jgi:hypothetical protein